MKYDVVKESKYQKFLEIVNQLIEEGWKPQGGICAILIFPALDSWVYLQAMMKEE